MRKQQSCLEREIKEGTMPGACRRGRPHTAWMDNIKTWTGLSVEESIRMTEDKMEKVWPTLGFRMAKDQKRIDTNVNYLLQTVFMNICNLCKYMCTPT